VSRTSQLNIDKLVDFELKARLDYIYERPPFKERRVKLPLIMVFVSPGVKSLEVERVRLLKISSIGLDMVEGSLTLHITFHVGLDKNTPSSSIPSFLRRLIPSRVATIEKIIEKSVSVPPKNPWRYWGTVYLGLLHKRIKVRVFYIDSGRISYEYITDIHINQDLEARVLEAFQRHALEKLPPKIYSNPAYLNYLKNYKLLRKLSKKTLRELADHGIVSSSGEALTYFGRMYLLWVEKRGQLLAKTLVAAET